MALVLKSVLFVNSYNSPVTDRLIEFTKEILEQQQESGLYVFTNALLTAQTILDKQRMLFIKGSEGTGKSSLGRELLLRGYKSFDEVMILPTPEEFIKVFDNKKKQLFFIDDIFGKTNFCEQSFRKWCYHFSFLEQCVKLGCTSLIVTSRSNIVRHCIERLKQMSLFDLNHIVDLSSKCFELTKEEKREMLLIYLRNRGIKVSPDMELFSSKPYTISKETIETIVGMKSLHGFPHCVYLFVSNLDFLKQGSKYFEFPEKFLKNNIETIRESDEYAYLSLVFLMWNGGSVESSCLHTAKLIKDHTFLETCESLGFSSSMNTSSKLIHTIKEMSQSEAYIQKLEKFDKYVFTHESITEAVVLSYGKHFPDLFLNKCPWDLLWQYARTDSSKLKGEIAVTIQEDYYEVIVERLIVELKNGNQNVLLHRILEDDSVLQEFVDIVEQLDINDLNIPSPVLEDMKHQCIYSGYKNVPVNKGLEKIFKVMNRPADISEETFVWETSSEDRCVSLYDTVTGIGMSVSASFLIQAAQHSNWKIFSDIFEDKPWRKENLTIIFHALLSESEKEETIQKCIQLIVHFFPGMNKTALILAVKHRRKHIVYELVKRMKLTKMAVAESLCEIISSFEDFGGFADVFEILFGLVDPDIQQMCLIKAIEIGNPVAVQCIYARKSWDTIDLETALQVALVYDFSDTDRYKEIYTVLISCLTSIPVGCFVKAVTLNRTKAREVFLSKPVLMDVMEIKHVSMLCDAIEKENRQLVDVLISISTWPVKVLTDGLRCLVEKPSHLGRDGLQVAKMLLLKGATIERHFITESILKADLELLELFLTKGNVSHVDLEKAVYDSIPHTFGKNHDFSTIYNIMYQHGTPVTERCVMASFLKSNRYLFDVLMNQSDIDKLLNFNNILRQIIMSTDSTRPSEDTLYFHKTILVRQGQWNEEFLYLAAERLNPSVLKSMVQGQDWKQSQLDKALEIIIDTASKQGKNHNIAPFCGKCVDVLLNKNSKISSKHIRKAKLMLDECPEYFSEHFCFKLISKK